MENITLQNGEISQINIQFFPAWEGYHLQSEYSEFVRSSDVKYREEYVMKILRYAEVVKEEQNIPLLTPQLVSNQLQSWQNVEQIFKAILIKNGIDPELHAQKSSYWDKAGKELAAAFIVETTRLIGPAMSALAEAKEGNKMSDEIEKFVLEYKVELSDSIQQLKSVQDGIAANTKAQKEYDAQKEEARKNSQQELAEKKAAAAEEKRIRQEQAEENKRASEEEKRVSREESEAKKEKEAEEKTAQSEQQKRQKEAEEASKRKKDGIQKIGNEIDKLIPGFGKATEKALSFGGAIKGFAGPAAIAISAMAALAYSIKQVTRMRDEYNAQRLTAWNTGQSTLMVEQNQRQLTAASGGLLNGGQARTLMEKIQSQVQDAYTDPNPANVQAMRLRMAGTSGYDGGKMKDVTTAMDEIGKKMRSVSVEQANAIGMTLGLTQNETAALRNRNEELQRSKELSAGELVRRQQANAAMESLNSSFGSLDETFRNTGDIVAEEFMPIFANVMHAVSDFLSGLPEGVDHAVTGFEKFNLAFSSFMQDIQDPKKIFSGEVSFSKNYKDAAAVIEKQQQAAKEAANKQNDAAQQQKSTAANNEKAIKLFSASVNTMAGVVDEQQAWAAWAGSVGAAGGLKGMGQGAAGTAVNSGGGAGQQYGGYSSPEPGSNATSAFNFGNMRNFNGEGFRSFNNAQEGMAAQANQLLRYFTGKTTGHNLQTINDIISTWAPKNENNTQAYIKYMSQKMGVNAGQKLDFNDSDMLGRFMYYQAIYEKGADKIQGNYSESDFRNAARNFHNSYAKPAMSTNYSSEGNNAMLHAQTRNTVRLDEIYNSVVGYIGGGMTVGQLRNGGAAKSDIKWALDKDMFDSQVRVSSLQQKVNSPQLAKNHAQYANELLSAEQHLNALKTFSNTVLSSGYGSENGPRSITIDRPVYNMQFYGITDPKAAASAVQGALSEQTKQINNNNNSGISH